MTRQSYSRNARRFRCGLGTSGNSCTGKWVGILGGIHETDCVLFMSRLKKVSGLPYKIVIESWYTHTSSSSHEALLWKVAA